MWTLILLLLTASASAKKFGGGGGRSQSTSHSYPHSNNGYSGTGSGGSHSYPPSNGYSGSNYVPKQTQHNTNYGHKTEVHNHYHNHHYSPPQQVGYGAHSYPVYHSAPPVYVYQYRDSGSRFGTLLTGLALFNLGRMTAGSNHHYDANREYRGNPGEVCKFGIRKSNGDYEETRVECRLMSSFIWESSPQHVSDQPSERKTVTTTVVNVTQTHGEGGPQSDNSTTTVTVTNTTVVDALHDKGQSIHVTPEMTCYLIRTTRDGSYMKKEVPCGLLQTYAQTSWRPNSSDRITSIFTIIVIPIFFFQVM